MDLPGWNVPGSGAGEVEKELTLELIEGEIEIVRLLAVIIPNNQ